MRFNANIFDKMTSAAVADKSISAERDAELRELKKELVGNAKTFWNVVQTFGKEQLDTQSAVMIAEILLVGFQLGALYMREVANDAEDVDDITDTTRCVN